MKEVYYVCKVNGENRRVAKFVDSIPYGWEKDKWIEMPGLISIKEDVTDFEEISKKEAEKITKWQKEHWEEYMKKIKK